MYFIEGFPITRRHLKPNSIVLNFRRVKPARKTQIIKINVFISVEGFQFLGLCLVYLLTFYPSLYRVIRGNWEKYALIARARKHSLAYYQGGKVNWWSYILIFHGHNQYKWFSKLLFHLASISLKIEIFDFLCKKSVLLSCLVILSLGLKIEYS
jgi:hypothetical protein